MNNYEKPNFESNPTINKVETENLNKLVEARSQRPECGAVWKRQSKATGLEFLKLRLNRKQLKELLSQTNDTDECVDFVAFKNNSATDDNKRPLYRVFRSLD